MKEMVDVYRHGEKRYRGKPGEYVRNGMWNSIATFLGMYKRYPLMSTAVTVGAGVIFGFPLQFLGALWGVGIIGFSALGIGTELYKASKIPKMNEEKAEHLKRVGENIDSLVITSIGGQGIVQGIESAIKSGANGFKAMRHLGAFHQWNKAVWDALWSPAPAGMGPLATFLFVSGLFDNVLEPFNNIANKLNEKEWKNKKLDIYVN